MSEHPNAAIVRSAYEAMAKGDVAAFAALLDDDVTWHESTPGFEGDYQGRDQVLGLLGKVFEETGIRMDHISIHDILATDDHTVILHETTMSRGERNLTAKYADVYHLRNGKLSEHWHLPVDPKADAEFMTG
jgi:ketosteroid isomerase-like protein